MVAERLDVQIKQTRILINISYNNDNVIIIISQYIENPGIVRTVDSGIFRHIQGHSAIFIHGQAYWELLSHVKSQSDILGTLRNPSIYNRAIFRTLAYLEPKISWPTKIRGHYVTCWRPKLRSQFSENLVLWIYEFLFILAIEFPKKKNYRSSEN